MRIAIIGSGISGLVSGYLLSRNYNVVLYEANSYLGGHTNTIEISEASGPINVDTGFIVFNKKTYPNFVKLIEILGVPYQPSDMSFSVKCGKTGFEYNGTTINSLFAQRKNIFNPKMYAFISGILKFNKAAKHYLAQQKNEQSLKDFVASYEISERVVKYYLIPMAASVWSADPKQMWEFPALFMLRFWLNHGFLEVDDRPQWYVIKGGSKNYIPSLIKSFESKIRLATPVMKISRKNNQIQITDNKGEIEIYDKVVIATHSDQALSLLDEPSAEELACLKAIPYQKNTAVLHTDTSVLPRAQLAVAAWNYFIPEQDSSLPTLTYNMNILQSLKTNTSYNVSLNMDSLIDPAKVIRKIDYEHPVFTLEGMEAQKKLALINGDNNTFFAGAYLRNGFHEDGVVSALKVAEKLGVLL